jgi:hypothetical protein
VLSDSAPELSSIWLYKQETWMSRKMGRVEGTQTLWRGNIYTKEEDLVAIFGVKPIHDGLRCNSGRSAGSKEVDERESLSIELEQCAQGRIIHTPAA